MSIYRDLFSSEGSELYVKPISLYFPPEQISNLTFADCVLAAHNRNELCIGVIISARVQDKNQSFSIDFIASLDNQLNLTLDDGLITLAEDET
ncbi:hypothetical protein QUA54_06705 [Microcoleus sp. MOSTC5]|uniref:hypothetical protein n=1 Tax=Microcoleus sp. MOSTC5 TaxID=3055378 RepID=UPI002FCFA8A1